MRRYQEKEDELYKLVEERGDCNQRIAKAKYDGDEVLEYLMNLRMRALSLKIDELYEEVKVLRVLEEFRKTEIEDNRNN